MKSIRIFLLSVAVASAFTACVRNDDLNPNSIFDDEEIPVRSQFDRWLLKNYTDSFNINLIYRYSDRESNNSYNVVPTQEDKAIAMAILLRHVWLHAYQEVMGPDFIKTYSPRVIQLIGSGQYDGTGKETLGVAEGGLKITLLRVNALTVNTLYIDVDNPIPDKEHVPMDLNYWFFHTMHHEFCHILTQNKDYTTDFRTVSVGEYIPSDWYNKSDNEMIPEGFVSAYASSEPNEDFAETYAYYVTHSQKAWDALLSRAGTEGAAKIKAKFEKVRDYFSDSWGVDLDVLRSVVLRRFSEIPELDLKNINLD